MAVFEVTLVQSYFSQIVMNRWNYVGTGTPVAVSMSYALMYALGFVEPPIAPETGVDFWSRLRQLQNTAVFNLTCSIKDVHSDTDFYSLNLSGAPGLVVGENSASFLAFGFRTSQTRKSVRPGQKRIVGVTDGDTISGGGFSGGAVARMDNFALEMTENQVYDDLGQTLTFQPAICAKKPYTTPSGKTAYKYYPTLAEQMDHTAISIAWTKKGSVRSQVSRQIGRGV